MNPVHDTLPAISGPPPSADAQARLLLLIDVFSGTTGDGGVEGRMKLAKLDFLLRYPDRFKQMMAVRGVEADLGEDPWLTGAIEQSMIRYRYGPWDPAYYSLLGALIGKGLIQPSHRDAIATYRTTPAGRQLARALAETDSWRPVRHRARLLRRHLNLSGTRLKDLIYQTFPDIVEANWGTAL
ncbi:hypothetical protein ACIG63_33480 [Streptomyces antimycoticus]|uniref:hypothetical protein n=1 Tax=Streptomyces antimycoticus TaxID=68175 RepID=UPI0037D1CBB8